MEQSLDAAVPHESDLHRFLDRALFRFESAALVVLLLISLVQPTMGRMSVPTWALLLLALGYRLLIEVLRTYVPALHAFTWKYVLDVPVAALIYVAGAAPGGPLFVLFFLAIACAAASILATQSIAQCRPDVVIVQSKSAEYTHEVCTTRSHAVKLSNK